MNVHVRAKGNPMKAVREGSIIFHFERPTSQRVPKVRPGAFRDHSPRIN